MPDVQGDWREWRGGRGGVMGDGWRRSFTLKDDLPNQVSGTSMKRVK
jgi:hypothetical protein